MNWFGHHVDKLDGVVVFPSGVEFLGALKRPLKLEGGKLQMIFNHLSQKFKVCLIIYSDGTQT